MKPTPELTALSLVRPPRAARKLAFSLVALFIVLPPALLMAPWQQNVQAQGASPP